MVLWDSGSFVVGSDVNGHRKQKEKENDSGCAFGVWRKTHLVTLKMFAFVIYDKVVVFADLA